MPMRERYEQSSENPPFFSRPNSCWRKIMPKAIDINKILCGFDRCQVQGKMGKANEGKIYFWGEIKDHFVLENLRGRLVLLNHSSLRKEAETKNWVPHYQSKRHWYSQIISSTPQLSILSIVIGNALHWFQSRIQFTEIQYHYSQSPDLHRSNFNRAPSLWQHDRLNKNQDIKRNRNINKKNPRVHH